MASGIKLVASGLCLSRLESGEVIFVDGLLPGEHAKVRETRTKGKTKFGEIEELVDISPARVDPPCVYVEQGCGGCDWQHINLESQREYKREIVIDALERIAKVPQARDLVKNTIELEDKRYRTTARILCDSSGWGFRAKHSHDIVRIQDCMVLNEECQRQALDVVESICISVEPNAGVKSELHEAQVRRSPGELLNVMLSLSRESFYQGHIRAPEILIKLLMEEVGIKKNLNCVDLYSGVGVFALALASKGHKVIAVEGNHHAIGDAYKNLEGFDAKIIHSDVKKFRYDEELFSGKCDLVVADPSREGISKNAIDALLSCHANKVVLISCDPAAGARDGLLLLENGYNLKSCVPIDMFSYTHHVEMFSIFERYSFNA